MNGPQNNQIPGKQNTINITVASQAAMLALTGLNVTDIIVRSDLQNALFQLIALPATNLSNWQQIGGSTPTTNSITNTQLAQAPANTWVGNNTNSTANKTDNATGNLTETGSSILNINGGTNSLLRNVSIEIDQANTSQSGYLSDTDWNTFNNKIDQTFGNTNYLSKNVASYTNKANPVGSDVIFIGDSQGGSPAPVVISSISSLPVSNPTQTVLNLKSDKIPNTLAISNLPTGGVIGSAASTVDIYEAFTITQTTTGQTATLPIPTVLTNKKICYIENSPNSTASLSCYGVTLAANTFIQVIFNGTSWTPASVTAGSGTVTSFNSRTGAVTPQTGDYSFSQINGQITGTQLPNPGSASLGGIKSSTASANKFASGVDTSGNVVYTQPAASDVSGLANSATTDATNLANDTLQGTFTTQNTPIVSGDSGQVIAQKTQGQINTLAPLNSPTFTGTPTAPTAPITDNSNTIADTAFVQALIAQSKLSQPLNFVTAISTSNFAATYNNGTSGVGATLTATTVGIFTIDGQTPVIGKDYAFSGQISSFQNGIYTCTSFGVGIFAVFTRRSDFDQPAEMTAGRFMPVQLSASNPSNAGAWITLTNVNTVGTDNIAFVNEQVSLAGLMYGANNFSDVANPAIALSNINGVPQTRTINAQPLSANIVLNTDNIQESGSPTNKWFTNARAIASTLTSFAASTKSAITSSDTILTAFQKVQAWLSALANVAFSGSASDIQTGTLPVAQLPVIPDSKLNQITTANKVSASSIIISAAQPLYADPSTGSLSVRTDSVTTTINNLSQLAVIASATPTINTIPKWDANNNMSANSFIPGITFITASATPVQLSATSTMIQNVSGSVSQTFYLPNATTLNNALPFSFQNESSAILIIMAFDKTTVIGSVPANSDVTFELKNNSTTNGTWHTQSNQLNTGSLPSVTAYTSFPMLITVPSGGSNIAPGMLASTNGQATTATTGKNNSSYRQIGNTMDMRWSYRSDTATSVDTPGSTPFYLIPIPFGQIDTSITGSLLTGGISQDAVGEITFNSSDGSFAKGSLYVYDSTHLYVEVSYGSGYGSAQIWNSNFFQFYGSGIIRTFTISNTSIPIVGWSNIVASNANSFKIYSVNSGLSTLDSNNAIIPNIMQRTSSTIITVKAGTAYTTTEDVIFFLTTDLTLNVTGYTNGTYICFIEQTSGLPVLQAVLQANYIESDQTLNLSTGQYGIQKNPLAGYKNTGSGQVSAELVKIGQFAITGGTAASSITSGITFINYAFNRKYSVKNTSVGLNNSITFNPNIGSVYKFNGYYTNVQQTANASLVPLNTIQRYNIGQGIQNTGSPNNYFFTVIVPQDNNAAKLTTGNAALWHGTSDGFNFQIADVYIDFYCEF